MVTVNEIELLASLLARAGVTRIEAMWANSVLEKLRATALQQQAAAAQEQENGPGTDSD